MLIALWVRSYYILDEFSEPISRARSFGLTSIEGQFSCSLEKVIVPIQSIDWGLESHDSTSGYAQAQFDEASNWMFAGDQIDYWTIRLPHWFLVLTCIVITAIPWLRWHFSLRTLLIATTLVAVVVGAIVYATRQ